MGHDWEHGGHPGVQKAVVGHYEDKVTGVGGPVHVWYVQV